MLLDRLATKLDPGHLRQLIKGKKIMSLTKRWLEELTQNDSVSFDDEAYSASHDPYYMLNVKDEAFDPDPKPGFSHLDEDDLPW
jgi:hypothetical protein